jgi:AraC-like DNA-binding protein
MEQHRDVFAFAQRAQTLAAVLLEPDPLRRWPGVWDFLAKAPRCSDDADRVVVAMILRRLAEAFLRVEEKQELPPTARLRRTSVADVHCSRALHCIRRDFANAALDLNRVAQECRLSAPYLSNLISVSTGYGLHTHLGGVRVLHSLGLLSASPLSVQEVVHKSGFKSTSAFDRELKHRFCITPSEFRRWA